MPDKHAHILTKAVLGFLGVALMGLALLGGCGQQDPVQPITGAIFVSSDTSGAAIFLDGEDSGQATPDTLGEISVGRHVVRVRLEGFVSTPESLVVQVSSGQIAEAFFAMNKVAGSRRLVLLEHFTSVNCGPCPQTNRIINGLLQDFGPAKVVGIEYHPWPADPFYDAANFENITRKNYYNITSVPDIFVGGLASPDPFDSLDIVEAVDARLDQMPPLAIVVTDTVVGQSWAGTAQVIGLTDIVSSDLRGFFVVLEKEVHYSQPPGTNGEKDFYFVMRKIVPAANGEMLNISAGDTLTISQECDLHPDCDPAEIYSIYFVQDYLNKEIFQAGTSLPAETSRFSLMRNLR